MEIIRILLASKLHKCRAATSWAESNKNVVEWHEDMILLRPTELEGIRNKEPLHKVYTLPTEAEVGQLTMIYMKFRPVFCKHCTTQIVYHRLSNCDELTHGKGGVLRPM